MTYCQRLGALLYGTAIAVHICHQTITGVNLAHIQFKSEHGPLALSSLVFSGKPE